MTDNSDIVPLFSTGASLKQGGIWTVEKAGAAKKAGRKHGPVSLCDLAKQEGLTQLHIVDDRFANMFAAQKALKETGCALVFGLKVTVCDDMADKSEASLRNESKVVIWMAGDGSADYQALINLYTLAAQQGFYYVPRLDWKTLKAQWHDSLLLSLPFYSSFLARNTLTFASIVPDLPAAPLVLREVAQELPFDTLIDDAVARYVQATGSEVQRVKSVYYRRREDAKAFMVWRCILNRGATWDKPNQDWMWSREFAWDAYRELTAPVALQEAA
jgi:DNA polymerase III alpha subunit